MVQLVVSTSFAAILHPSQMMQNGLYLCLPVAVTANENGSTLWLVNLSHSIHLQAISAPRPLRADGLRHRCQHLPFHQNRIQHASPSLSLPVVLNAGVLPIPALVAWVAEPVDGSYNVDVQIDPAAVHANWGQFSGSSGPSAKRLGLAVGPMVEVAVVLRDATSAPGLNRGGIAEDEEDVPVLVVGVDPQLLAARFELSRRRYSDL